MFDVLAFGGERTRCLWQGGFLQRAPKQWLAPTHILAVSAGALSAVSYIVGNEEKVRKEMKKPFQSIDHNLHWSAFFNGKAIAPHLEVYRQAVTRAFNDEDIKKLRGGPDFHILLTRPPEFLPPKVASILGVSGYQFDLIVRGTLHSAYAGQLGFFPSSVKAPDIKSASDLCEFLIVAGCIPPIIPLQTWRTETFT